MKNVITIIFCFIVSLSFSQNNFSMNQLTGLKDINGIQLHNDLFANKYTLVYNLKNKSEINSSLTYFKEASKIYKSAIFNSIENKGLTLLVFLHSNKLNFYEHPVFEGLIIVPVYLSDNSKILNSNLISCKNMLINSSGNSVKTNFIPSDLRLDLTNYLKRK